MIAKTSYLTGWFALLTMSALLIAPIMPAQDKPQAAAAQASDNAAANFSDLADTALVAMKKRAEELKITGVAVVAYAPGDTVNSWTSKMVVVGTMTNPATGTNSGNNLLGIAYTKAAEMADTLKDSGSKVRKPMTGEYGWQGGKVAKGKTGILIAAFSGGASSQDVKVSQAGLEILASKL